MFNWVQGQQGVEERLGSYAEGWLNPRAIASECSLDFHHLAFQFCLYRQEEHFQRQCLIFSPAPGPLCAPSAACTGCLEWCVYSWRITGFFQRKMEGKNQEEKKPLSFDVKSKSSLRIVCAPIKLTRYACHSTKSPSDHPWLPPQRNISNTNAQAPFPRCRYGYHRSGDCNLFE